jgi:hypothetical protein
MNKLNQLISKIKQAREETIKAQSYADGYFDCIKDILNNEESDINKILEIKYDGKIRNDVYTEMLLQLEDLSKSSVAEVVHQPEKSSDHPSERAKAFLERIGRN